MKVLLVNTSETTGGAAIACGRILKALRSEGADASMMVRNAERCAQAVIPVGGTLQKRWCFIRERAAIWAANGFRKDKIFYVDIANCGIDISKTESKSRHFFPFLRFSLCTPFPNTFPIIAGFCFLL